MNEKETEIAEGTRVFEASKRVINALAGEEVPTATAAIALAQARIARSCELSKDASLLLFTSIMRDAYALLQEFHDELGDEPIVKSRTKQGKAKPDKSKLS